MPVEAGGFGSGDPRISRRPKPGNRSRSKPVVRTSATYLSAGRTDGSCLGRRTSVACEDRTNLRIALFLARGAVSNPAAHQRPASGFHAFEPLAGGPQPQCGREAPSVAEAIIDVSDLSGSPSGYENHAWSQHSVATPVARSISAIGRGLADSPAKTPCRALRNCCSSVRKMWTVTAVSDSATGFRSPADAMMLRILNQGLPLHFECY